VHPTIRGCYRAKNNARGQSQVIGEQREGGGELLITSDGFG